MESIVSIDVDCYNDLECHPIGHNYDYVKTVNNVILQCTSFPPVVSMLSSFEGSLETTQVTQIVGLPLVRGGEYYNTNLWCEGSSLQSPLLLVHVLYL